MRRVALASLIALSACGWNDIPPRQARPIVYPPHDASPMVWPAAYRSFSTEGSSLSGSVARSSSSETLGSERALREEQDFLRRRAAPEPDWRASDDAVRRGNDEAQRERPVVDDACRWRNRDRPPRQRELCERLPPW